MESDYTGLRPCPFCGGAAVVARSPERGGFHDTPASARVTCVDCGAKGPERSQSSGTDYVDRCVLCWQMRDDR